METHFDFSYTPEPRPGATQPKQEGLECHGRDLRAVTPPDSVDLNWLVEAYTYRDPAVPFFKTSGFTKHAGTENLQKQIETGWDANRIRTSWQESLQVFLKIRAKYLIYD